MKPIRKRFSRPFRHEPMSEGVLGVALLAMGILAARIVVVEMRALPKTLSVGQACELRLGDFTMLALFILGLAFSVASVKDACKKADQK